MPGISAKDVSLGSYTVSISRIKEIYAALSGVVVEQADIDLARWIKKPNQTDDEFNANKQYARQNAYRLTVSVHYADGTVNHGWSAEALQKDPQGPAISLVYLTNVAAFRAEANMDPYNRFSLWLDFSQPPLLDSNTLISSPTTNRSSLRSEGDRPGWFAGIEKAVLDRIDRRHNLRRFLHGPFVYDYALLLFGTPFALYLCWLSLPSVQDWFERSAVLQAGASIYVFLFGVGAYRILFSYLRWAYPLAELAEQLSRPRRHRLFWWGIAATIIAKVFWDIADPFLTLRPLLGLDGR